MVLLVWSLILTLSYLHKRVKWLDLTQKINNYEKHLHLQSSVQVQLAFLQPHLAPQPLLLRQLHLTSSRQAWLAHFAVHELVPSFQLQPHDDGLGLFWMQSSLVVHMLAWYTHRNTCWKRAALVGGILSIILFLEEIHPSFINIFENARFVIHKYYKPFQKRKIVWALIYRNKGVHCYVY